MHRGPSPATDNRNPRPALSLCHGACFHAADAGGGTGHAGPDGGRRAWCTVTHTHTPPLPGGVHETRFTVIPRGRVTPRWGAGPWRVVTGPAPPEGVCRPRCTVTPPPPPHLSPGGGRGRHVLARRVALPRPAPPRPAPRTSRGGERGGASARPRAASRWGRTGRRVTSPPRLLRRLPGWIWRFAAGCLGAAARAGLFLGAAVFLSAPTPPPPRLPAPPTAVGEPRPPPRRSEPPLTDGRAGRVGRAAPGGGAAGGRGRRRLAQSRVAGSGRSYRWDRTGTGIAAPVTGTGTAPPRRAAAM